MSDIRVYKNKDELVRQLSAKIRTIESNSIDERGRFTIALAGGSTPKALYEFLATVQPIMQWDKWHVFFGDERTVPPDDVDSNFHMVQESLLSKVAIPEHQIYRMKGELEPKESAEQYSQVLKDVFGDDRLPQFDLILLGMGDDGHTASLFPRTEAIHEQEKWVVAHYVEKLDTWRITLTPSVINTAHHIIFMVTGEKKAKRLNQVLNGEYQPDTLPSQIINPTNGELHWYIDDLAASELS